MTTKVTKVQLIEERNTIYAQLETVREQLAAVRKMTIWQFAVARSGKRI